jgi:hypothetical protein
MSNPATITLEVPSTVTREFQVLVDEDDAYASASDQTVLSPSLRVGRHSSGMRFRNLDLPPGSEILSAFLKVSVGGGSLAGRVAGAVQAEVALNPPDFTEANPDLYDRLVTDALVPWTWQAQTLAPMSWYASDDIGTAVQEIVDQPGWLPGNPIAILYSGDAQNSRDIEFFACAHPNFDRAAKLQITYDPNRDWVPPASEEPSAPGQPDQDATPPAAEDGAAETPFNTPITIALAATDDGLPDPPGKLSYAITSLADHGTLERPDGTAITGPGALPAYNNEVVYWPDPDFSGRDSFTFTADDGGTAPSGGTSNAATVTITVRPAPANTTTVEYQVNKGEDDACAAPASPWNNVFDRTLYVGVKSSGMRFADINIPRGSTIVSAHLKINFCRSINYRIEGLIQAEATGSAGSFLSADRQVCRLATTGAGVPWIWEPRDHGDCDDRPDGTWHTSPDIAKVVQEITDRSDWSEGNAIAIIFSSETSPPEDMSFSAYDDAGVRAAPKLEITYAY